MDRKMSPYAVPGITRIDLRALTQPERARLLESIICGLHSVEPVELHKRGRKRRALWPRQMTMWYLVRWLKFTLVEAGQFYIEASDVKGTRMNHATIIRAMTQHKNRLDTEAEYRKLNAQIRAQLIDAGFSGM